MIKTQITIINKLGLHARAATKLVATTSKFAATIRVGKDGKLVDAKSIMALMLLAASKGTVLEFEFDGKDEQAAHDEVKALIGDYFHEGE